MRAAKRSRSRRFHLLENRLLTCAFDLAEAIVYTWDYRSSASIWAALRVQPILSDEVQAFKALITIHKILQEGHPVVRYLDLACFLLSTGQKKLIGPPWRSTDSQGGAGSNVLA